MNQKKLFLMVLFILMFICGCTPSVEDNHSTPSFTPTARPSRTPENIPTRLSTTGEPPTSTPTLTPATEIPRQPTSASSETDFLFTDLIQIEDLPPGQYITFYKYADSSLMALSFQGKQDQLFKSDRDKEFRYSHNTHFLTDEFVDVIDIFKKRKVFINPIRDSTMCNVDDVSGNGMMVSGNCTGGNISIYTELSGWTEIFQNDKHLAGYYMQPSISNQGSYISLCDTYGIRTRTRIAKVDTCYQTSSCTAFARATLPFCAQHGLAWHPNGKWGAALSDDDKLYIISTSTNEITIIEHEYYGYLEKDMAWSPDGNWIVFNGYYHDQNDTSQFRMYLYLYSVQSGTIQIFETDASNFYELAGWLNVHSKFHEGGRYIVLPREDKLYLQSKSGVEGEPVLLLQEGDEITVLDQTAEVGDERWWLVEANGQRGWVLETMDFFQDDWKSELRPPIFAIGSHLVVTAAGEGLRLRENASVEGEIIRRLQTTVRMSIIDGPQKADGYTWWKVMLDDSNITGWIAEEKTWFASIPGQ